MQHLLLCLDLSLQVRHHLLTLLSLNFISFASRILPSPSGTPISSLVLRHRLHPYLARHGSGLVVILRLHLLRRDGLLLILLRIRLRLLTKAIILRWIRRLLVLVCTLMLLLLLLDGIVSCSVYLLLWVLLYYIAWRC